ncbi:MAG: helix-turn-helix domain-containing protein [Cellulosilyticaceae bacterium]
MNFTDALFKLGFSPIEANVFSTLCKHGALTGYEVAKFCGISRSNVYAALYSLQDKGKCYIIEGESIKYIPLTKDELLLEAHRELHEVIVALETHFPETRVSSEPYITIKGYDNVLAKVKNTILSCHSHLYFLASKSYIDLFSKELLEIVENRRVTIMSDGHIDLANALIYKRGKPPEGFHVIIDTSSVITGDINVSSSQCLYTTNPALVRFMRESFITELEMIKFTDK